MMSGFLEQIIDPEQERLILHKNTERILALPENVTQDLAMTDPKR